MSVDNWFDYWITNLICNLAPNTLRNYRERYMRNVQPVIGSMCMGDVKPMHCKIILNQMESSYAGSTILQTYIAMGTMFKAAVMNDVILKHPIRLPTRLTIFCEVVTMSALPAENPNC